MSNIKKSHHKLLRVYDKLHAEIILRARQYFELERAQKKRKNLHRGDERTAEAIRASRKIVFLIRTEDDEESWNYSYGQHVSFARSMQVHQQFCSLIRQIVREILLQKRCVPIIDNVFSKLLQLQVKDVENLNLFPGAKMPPQKSLVCKCSRVSLYLFMNSIGYIYG